MNDIHVLLNTCIHRNANKVISFQGHITKTSLVQPLHFRPLLVRMLPEADQFSSFRTRSRSEGGNPVSFFIASAELLNFGLVGDSDGTTRLSVKAATNNSNYVSTLRNPNMEIHSITKAPRGDSSSPQHAPLPLTNKMAVGFEMDSVVDVVHNPT